MTAVACMLLRTSCFLGAFPNFFGAGVPAPIKAAMAVLFTLFFAMAGPLHPVALTARGLLGEAAIGLGMGFILRLSFFAFQSAGEVLGFTTSATATMSGGAFSDGPENILGHAYGQVALLLFFAAGGPAASLQALGESLKLVPPGMGAPGLMPIEQLLPLAGRFSMLAVALCLPPLAAGLLAQWGMGIVMRVAPQFQLFSFSLPVGAMAGLWLLSLYLPAWPSLFNAAFGESLRGASTWAGAMAR